MAATFLPHLLSSPAPHLVVCMLAPPVSHHPPRRPIICASSAIAPPPAPLPSPPAPAHSPPQRHHVVIVGAGIAGLALALALHRVGIKSVVLEKSNILRTTGTAIGTWTNAWKALEVLGVAEGLREKFPSRVTASEFYTADGKCLTRLEFPQDVKKVELRAVERKVLLEALREPLPLDTIYFNAQVVGINKIAGGRTEVQLQNGSTIQTKVLVGCDGIGSVVARWMGFKEPRYAGYIGIRGVAAYPEGHNVEAALRQTVGLGVRSGLLPMDSNRLYWYVMFNSSSVGKITDPELVREEALSFVKGWPSIITEAIKKSQPETLTRAVISDRWMWPFGGPSPVIGGVTLAGDAMHPVTPNLGQGGCCALEDAVILGRTLSKALNLDSIMKKDSAELNASLMEGDTSQEIKRIEVALGSYTKERQQRMFPMAIRSYVIGAILNVDLPFVCAVRDKLIPKILKLEPFIDHTFFDCGKL